MLMRPTNNPTTMAKEIASHLQHATDWHINVITGYIFVRVSNLTDDDIHYLATIIRSVLVYPYNDQYLLLKIPYKAIRL